VNHPIVLGRFVPEAEKTELVATGGAPRNARSVVRLLCSYAVAWTVSAVAPKPRQR